MVTFRLIRSIILASNSIPVPPVQPVVWQGGARSAPIIRLYQDRPGLGCPATPEIAPISTLHVCPSTQLAINRLKLRLATLATARLILATARRILATARLATA